MSNELEPIEHQKNALTQIVKFEEGLLNFLEHHELPSENIFVALPERFKVFKNIEDILSLIPSSEKSNSVYLSKFAASVACGLFDAALNYLWDETILQIRKRVVQYDLAYFYDNAVQNSEKRKKLSDDQDLIKLDDYELIKGAKEINLISDLGFKHLEFINFMRNWASAAHPNQNELTGLQLASWLETCVKEVITLPISNVAIRIKELLGGIKKTTISNSDAAEIGLFFENLTHEQVDNLVSGFFGIYINLQTDSQTRQNIVKLLPHIWPLVGEEIKLQFGIKYANYVANNYPDEKQLSRDFLKIVESESYIPEDLRIVEIEQTLENLLSVHRGLNNFHREPTFARQLKSIVGMPPQIPRNLRNRFIYGIVEVFLTNAHGVAYNAEEYYIEFLKSFDDVNSRIAAFAFLTDEISSKLQFSLCSDKYREMIGLIKNNITSPQIREILEKRIENSTGRLNSLRSDTQLQRQLKDLRIIK